MTQSSSTRTAPLSVGSKLWWQSSSRSPLWISLLIVVFWRIAIAVAGVWGYLRLPRGPNIHTLPRDRPGADLVTLIVDIGYRADGFWYTAIANHGYNYSARHISSVGYYPLYPLLTKVVSVVTHDTYVAAALVSLASLVLAVVTLRIWLEHRALEHRLPLVTMALLAYPFSFFYGAMMTEALYLFLALLTFTLFEKRCWFLAALAVLALVLTRPTGVVVLPCLFLLASADDRRSARMWMTLGVGVLGLAGFVAYQYVAFGTALAYVRTHAAPPNYNTIPQAIADVTLHARPGMPTWYLAFLVLTGLIFIALAPLVSRRFGRPYALYSVLSILLPLASSLSGMERYACVIFPAFVALALTRHKRLFVGLTVLGFWLGLLFQAFFVAGYGFF